MPKDAWLRTKQTKAAKRIESDHRRRRTAMGGFKTIEVGQTVLVRHKQNESWKPHVMQKSVTLQPFAKDGNDAVFRYQGWWIKTSRPGKR